MSSERIDTNYARDEYIALVRMEHGNTMQVTDGQDGRTRVVIANKRITTDTATRLVHKKLVMRIHAPADTGKRAYSIHQNGRDFCKQWRKAHPCYSEV